MGPHPTSRLKRFGQYPEAVEVEVMPLVLELPGRESPTDSVPPLP